MWGGGSTLHTVPIFEPLVTGLFKSSIRDNSKYSKKSPVIAFDKDWSLRFQVNASMLKSLFQVQHGPEFNGGYTLVITSIQSARLHVQYAKPIMEVPRHIRYSWPRFKVFSQTWTASGPDEKLRWTNLRSGSVPDALMISHRLRTEDDWYNYRYVKATKERSAYTLELSIRHNLSDRNIEYLGTDHSKTLLFHTKRSFDYKTVAPNHKWGQITAFSRSDLSITEQALQTLRLDKSIEVGINLTVNAYVADLGTTIHDPVSIKTGVL